jgi:hypothetical protein
VLRDLLIQVNRPRPSKTDPSIEINRVSKWQAAQVQVLHVTQSGGTSSSSNRAIVEVDVNTTPIKALISGASVAHLIEELGDLADEIITNGDVP